MTEAVPIVQVRIGTSPTSAVKIRKIAEIILKLEQGEPQHDKTNKMTCAPSEDRSAWASAQSDQSLRCALSNWVAKDQSFHHADSADMRKPVMPYANNKGADPRSLISTFVVRCLDSIIPLLAIAEISRP